MYKNCLLVTRLIIVNYWIVKRVQCFKNVRLYSWDSVHVAPISIICIYAEVITMLMLIMLIMVMLITNIMIISIIPIPWIVTRFCGMLNTYEDRKPCLYIYKYQRKCNQRSKLTVFLKIMRMFLKEGIDARVCVRSCVVRLFFHFSQIPCNFGILYCIMFHNETMRSRLTNKSLKVLRWSFLDRALGVIDIREINNLCTRKFIRFIMIPQFVIKIFNEFFFGTYICLTV